MSCCSSKSGEACAVPTAAPRNCPRCGRKGKSVRNVTLEHLLREPDARLLSGGPFFFCPTPDCAVVYFSADGGPLFEKPDLKVRVGVKETEDPISVCYCFGHTQASVWEEIERTGRSTVVESIKLAVQEGRCECEIKNPSGRCCLGEVTRAVQQGFARLSVIAARGQSPGISAVS